MLVSRLFPGTLRQAPAVAETPGYALLLRAGLVRALGNGSFLWLPYGQEVRRRFLAGVERRLEEMGAQQLTSGPLFAEAAEISALLDAVPGLRLRARGGQLLFAPGTGLLLLVHLLQHELRSHRWLPLTFYDVRFRLSDERSGSALLGTTQGLVVEAVTLCSGSEELSLAVGSLRRLVEETLGECGLQTVIAETAVEPGGFGGSAWLAPDLPGGRVLLQCAACGYAAEVEVAVRGKEALSDEELLPLEEVATPDCHTIAALAEYLGVPKERTAKAVFRMAGERFLFAIVRGDMEVNEAKLARLVGAHELRPAQEAEIAALGASPGYASPIGIRRSAPEAGIRQVLVVVDDVVPRSPNLVAGANREDTHLRNVNYGRDYVADIVGDIALARAGDPCSRCGAPLQQTEAALLARTWVPGDAWAEALTFQDAAGQTRPLLLACAEVEIDRAIAACAEQHHDVAGICWPAAVAPYAVYLVVLGEGEEIAAVGEELLRNLQAAGVRVLFDNRDESAGVKLTDADLLGAPLRVTVSRRALAAGGVEVKRREQPREAARIVPPGKVLDWVRENLPRDAR